MGSEVETSTILFALGLSLIAGLSTGIGSAIAFFAKEANKKLLTVAMGFSAGVMIWVSFAEILPDAKQTLVGAHGSTAGGVYALVAFFAGMLLIAAIDRLVPSDENPHEFAAEHEIEGKRESAAEAAAGLVEAEVEEASGLRRTVQIAATAAEASLAPAPLAGEPPASRVRLMRVGALTALALAVHNFPEGIATFVGAVREPAVGIPIAIAVAIHNVPEGIAISLPVFYATGSRAKAFWYSLFSGIAEPLGAVAAFLALMPFFGTTLSGLLFAAVAGIMVFISLDQLLPAAEEYGEHHLSIYGLVSGMAVMAVSLLLLE
ncbi:MAG: zinc transporter ZupT [Myxococcales bacterium]